MHIIPAEEQRRDEIIQLLQSQKLPAEDLPVLLTGFYTAIENDQLVGVIGMERYGRFGLLRSMVVHPGFRNRQIAETLVNTLEQAAKSKEIMSMYLLTETASKYFEKKGYKTIQREQVPEPVKASSEFSSVCPVSATVMMKPID